MNKYLNNVFPLIALFLIGSAYPAEGNPKTFYGPYVQAVTSTSAVICWVEGTAEVKVGTAPDKLEPAARHYLRHDIALEDLKPATRYFYDATQSGGPRGRGEFVTAPAGKGDFTFAVYGDSRSRPLVHKQIADRIAAHRPSLVLHTGDLVARGRKPVEWDSFFSSASALVLNTPLYPTLGNHEDDSPLYYQFFVLPGNKDYYSFNWGSVHFICLNSNPPRLPPGIRKSSIPHYRQMTEEYWKTQQEWLIRDLKANAKSEFFVAYFHHPPYSTNVRRKSDQEEMQENFCRILEKSGVSVVFNGHDHNYQHHLVNKVHYVVTAGGGAPLYDTQKEIRGITLKLAQIEHYLLVTVANRKMSFEVVDLNGNRIDQFVIAARSIPPEPPDADSLR